MGRVTKSLPTFGSFNRATQPTTTTTHPTTQPEVRMARGSKAVFALAFDFVDNLGLNSDSRSLNLEIRI